MPQIFHDDLQIFLEALFRRLDVAPNGAQLLAESLAAANLRGVDSHGVQLVLPYVDQIVSGNIECNTSGHIVQENGCCLLYDGENGLGQTVAARCCDEAVRLAKSFGIGMVVARNSNHFGRAAFWGERIVQAQCIGLVFTNSSPLVAPWQGKEARLGTNPICVAATRDWVLDMATTTVSAGRIVDTLLEGRSTLPDGWALDVDGEPAPTAAAALKGTLLPLGGREAGFKGSGLAVAVEILCGVLSGGALANEVGSLRSRDRAAGVSHTFIAIDIERFSPVGDFRARVESLVALLRGTPPAPGFNEVLIAGEPEEIVARERRSGGIPIPPRLWSNLLNISDRYQVERPKPCTNVLC